MFASFAHGLLPTLLAAFAAAAAAWLTWRNHRASLSDLTAPRKRAALACRVLLLSALFAVAAGLRITRTTDRLTVVFALDLSRSMTMAQRTAGRRFVEDALRFRRPTDQTALFTFAESPELQSAPSFHAAPSRAQHAGSDLGTDIAGALQAAASVIPPGSAGKIVVVSDGAETHGNALAVVPTLASLGFRIEALPVPDDERIDAQVERVLGPSTAKQGEPIRLAVVVRSTSPQRVNALLLEDGTPTGPLLPIDLRTGKQVIEIQTIARTKGVHRYDVLLRTRPGGDSETGNNRGMATVSVAGRPRVLYVTDHGHSVRAVTTALRAQGIDLSVVPPTALPTTGLALMAYDSLVLSDVAADMLSASQLEALHSSVRDLGMGFVMVGGENSFGLGGYRRTPVERVLPLSLDIRQMQRFPPVCVALVIDRSGSMEEGGGPGARKLDLALEAAIRAVQALKPYDKVAVITFTFGADVNVPLTSASRTTEIVAAIKQIGPGGGTSVYSGAQAAFDAIRADTTPIKHIILLTDGQSNDPDWQPLVAAMKRRRITMSSVAVGGGTGDVNKPLLAWLARSTGGRYYLVDRATDIPRIYLQEIERISSRPIVEEPFEPVATADAATELPGIAIGTMPPLLGYNVTQLKPSATLLLRSHRKDPIAAAWRYGLGRVVAFTSDDRPKWAVHWTRWSQFGRFWAQAIRWTMRTSTAAGQDVQLSIDRGRGRITAEVVHPDGRPRNALRLVGHVSGPAGMDGPVGLAMPLRQTGPGRYEATFGADKPGAYLARVSRHDGTLASAIASASVAYPPELAFSAPNRFMLGQTAAVGGGSSLTRPEQVFGENRPVVTTVTDPAPYLILAALFLLPIDIGLRRLAVGRTELVAARNWLARRWRRSERARVQTDEMDRLLAAKVRIGAALGDAGRAPGADFNQSARIPQPEDTQDRTVSIPPPSQPEIANGGPGVESNHMARLRAAKRRARPPDPDDQTPSP